MKGQAATSSAIVVVVVCDLDFVLELGAGRRRAGRFLSRHYDRPGAGEQSSRRGRAAALRAFGRLEVDVPDEPGSKSAPLPRDGMVQPSQRRAQYELPVPQRIGGMFALPLVSTLPALAGHRGTLDAETRLYRRVSRDAPGGNRTRGLRFERPLLFGSPKRTVDH